MTATRVLILGNADVGKTTFLVQLHGRVTSGRGQLSARGAPASLTPIEQGLKRLQQGVAVRHTAHGTDLTLTLPTLAMSGEPVDIVIPEYAGEDLRRIISDRRIPERWRAEAVAADRWLLLTRLSKHAELPDVLSRPIGELANTPLDDPSSDPDELPIDLWSVELLQALLHWRRQDTAARSRTLQLTLVLSCWDELDVTDGCRPDELAASRLALLNSFCRSHWPAGAFTAVGLSAQGHSLDEANPASDYLDEGPQQMGWIIATDGTCDPDLTRLVAGT